MMMVWMVVVTACSATFAFISATRRAGETRNRFSVPRSISSIAFIPDHMLPFIAFMATMPGIR
jgi:hypothetical protein